MASLPFTLRQLEYFDAVASEGSLAGAAERCRVSRAGLALALDELERHLALQLFVRRKGKGMTLTPAGTRMLSHARRLLAGAETLAADAWQSAGSLTGRFALGCFSTLSPFFLPVLLEHFRREHPALELDVVEADAVTLDDLLLRGRIDVALLYSVDVSTRLTFDAVRNYRPHVLVAADHRLASRGAIRLAEIVEEPLVALDVHPTHTNTERMFQLLGLRPRIGHVSHNYEMVRCLVGRGMGYAVLFQRAATSQTYDGHEVRQLDVLDRVPPTIAGLARPAGAPRTAKYGALREFLVATAGAAEARAIEAPVRERD